MRAAAKEEEFQRRIEPHRRGITLHCYRMLGSLQDAEEVAQESLVRGWQRLDELRSSAATRAWLYRIATNACLDLLKGRRRRSLPFDVAPSAAAALPLGPPAQEGIWVEPAPDFLLEVPDEDPYQRPDARVSKRESISLAFVTALQLLSPRQRAVLLLVDVLGWRPQEAADLLKTSVTSVNSLLQRARRTMETRSTEEDYGVNPEDEDLLQRYITTWDAGDLVGFVALLAEDAVLSMPPQPEWYAGREAVAQFLGRVLAGKPGYRRLLIRANNAPAVAVYSPAAGGGFEATAMSVLTIRRGKVARITRFTMPRLFPLFGLPEWLSEDDPAGRP